MRTFLTMTAVVACAVGLFGSVAFAQMHQDSDGRWLNSAGGNPYGDSNFNINADPNFNINADPNFNINADPNFNINADPNFNMNGDPKYNGRNGDDDSDE